MNVEINQLQFIADIKAVKYAFPKADTSVLKKIEPDAICGAWEKLSEAIKAKAREKTAWATAIAPYLNLNTPPSPSFRKLIDGIDRELKGSV